MRSLSFFLYLGIIILSGCTDKPQQESETNSGAVAGWPDGVTYEIFVQSFYDTNGDGIGDFNGLTEKVDYLAELGVDAVWLMPIMPSPSYHKYDVTDYRAVHPDYGTMDEFKAFVQKAHDAGIKVVIDLVINHSSGKHHWFVKAKNNDPGFREYYVWADKDSIAEYISKQSASGDSDNLTQWHASDGDTLAQHYYGFFWGGMPDLNFDSPKLRKEIYDIGRFWLEEVKVDGFRLDAARHIYPDHRAADNHAFWVEFKNEMQKVKPDVYLIGEVWAPTDISSPYTQGLGALFNFDLAFSIIESLNSGASKSAIIDGPSWKTIDSISLVSAFIKNDDTFKNYNPDFINATFLSNHDQNRVASMLGNDKKKIKLAASILLTLPGSPYLYYGEELGMLGMKPDPLIREPFLWKPQNEDTGRTTWEEAKFSTDQAVEPLSIQQADPVSVFNHYKSLINLRQGNNALKLGSIEEVLTHNPGLIAYTRTYEQEKMLAVHNISSEDLTLEVERNNDIIYKTAEGVNLSGSELTVPAYSSVILN